MSPGGPSMISLTSRLILFLSLVHLTHARIPLTISTNIPAVSVTELAGATCSTCNDNCPYRNDFPSSINNWLMSNKPSDCKNSLEPLHEINGIIADNGNVSFDANCSFVPSYYGSYSHFTFSVWLHFTCSACDLLKMRSDITMSYDARGLKLTIVNRTLIDTAVAVDVTGKWIHVVVRYNGYLSWFVEDRVHNLAITLPIGGNVMLGPNNTLDGGTTFSAADARWYRKALTDREIGWIHSGSTSSGKDICRCPDEYPTLVNKLGPANQLYCTNMTKEIQKTRMGTESGIPGFMFDSNTQTVWKSAVTNSAKFNVSLHKMVQLKKIELKDTGGMDELVVQLYHGTRLSSTWTYKSVCASTPNCRTITVSSGTFVADLEDILLVTRTDLDLLAADNIVIEMISNNMIQKTISEFKLEGRCFCHGNSVSCSVNSDGDYTCNCEIDSNTMGDNCGDCRSGFYRKQYNDTTCDHQCFCNMSGSETTACEQVGGNCPCKSNVNVTADRRCSVCNHNTVQLGSSSDHGCTSCNCDSDGIVRCEEDMSCTCKTNVEADTGKCTRCLMNYYGITLASGCRPCGCHSIGSVVTANAQKCDVTNGMCTCKSKVEGRQCDTCKDGYHDLNVKWPAGCYDCICNLVGTDDNNVCDKVTGQCPCIQANSTDNKLCKPVLVNVVPDYGPLAGGTLVTINGQLLGRSGSDVDVNFYINNTKQKVIRRSATFIEIKTEPVDTTGSLAVELIWTKANATPYFDKEFKAATKFTYKPNPIVTAPTTETKSYTSGGCSILIQGQSLDSVYEPKLLMNISQRAVHSMCSHTRDGIGITCKTPNVTSQLTSGSHAYGLVLDNVKDFMDLSELNPGSKIEIVEDPVIDKSDMEFTNTFDKTLTIKGQRLTEACMSADDMKVMLGDTVCDLTNRGSDSITCDPGEDWPGTSREVDVMVHIGSLQVRVGKLTFISFWSARYFLIGVGSLAGLIFLIILLVVCYKLRIWKKKEDTNIGIPFTTLTRPGAISNNNYTELRARESNQYDNPGMARVKPFVEEKASPTDYVAEVIKALKMDLGKVVKNSVVERSHVDPGNRCMHKGTNTRIINGQFSDSSSFPGDLLTMKCLVKPYKDYMEDGVLPPWLNDGLRECTRLQDFRNDNVLNMMGIAIDEKNIFVIYPEMKNRTLKDYLITEEGVKPEQKLAMCTDVAEGMSYLESENIVHKDLAARNCWVSGDTQVKIGDSAFSSDLFPKEYHSQKGRRLPVRWMAPESLRQHGFYSSKTDVWSYGVLIWEIFCGGSYLPYYDITDAAVQQCVCEKEIKLGKPQDCPEELYELMQKCFQDFPDERPQFSTVLHTLDAILSGEGENQVSYVNQKESLDLYENVVQTGPKLPPKVAMKPQYK